MKHIVPFSSLPMTAMCRWSWGMVYQSSGFHNVLSASHILPACTSVHSSSFFIAEG